MATCMPETTTSRRYRVDELRTRAFLDYQLDLQGNGDAGFRLVAPFGWPFAEYPVDGSYVALDKIASHLSLLDADFSSAAA
jgi:hypothetical protein